MEAQFILFDYHFQLIFEPKWQVQRGHYLRQMAQVRWA